MRIFFKDFLYIFSCKYLTPPPVWPQPTLLIFTYLSIHYMTMVPRKSCFSAQLFLRRFFWRIFSLWFFVKIRLLFVALAYPWGSWFLQLGMYTSWRCFRTSFLGWLGSKEKLFKYLLYIFQNTIWIPECCHTLPPGIMIFTILK